MRLSFYFLTFFSLFFVLPARSDNACLNSPEKAANYDIINEIKSSQDPLILAFNAQEARSGNSSQEHVAPPPPLKVATESSPWWCLTCLFRPRCVANSSNSFQDLKSVSEYFLKPVPVSESMGSKIKKECLISSLKRQPGSNVIGYACNNGKIRRSFVNKDSSKACLDQKTVDYLQFAIHQATECLSTPGSPMDPRMVFRMINNESAGNFYIGSTGGVGLTQLTSNPVEDMAGWYETEFIDPKTQKVVFSSKEGHVGYIRSRYYSLKGLQKKEHVFIEGNGSYVLQDIADSKNPACAPFKKMVEKDLQDPPPSPGKSANYCSWVSPGEGLAHNLIYGLGYIKYTRDKVIKPYLEKRAHAPNLANNQGVLDTLAMLSYGPDGAAEAKSLISTLRLNNSSNPAQVEQRLVDRNDYLQNTDSQMEQMLTKLKPAPYSAADLKGDSCITH